MNTAIDFSALDAITNRQPATSPQDARNEARQYHKAPPEQIALWSKPAPNITTFPPPDLSPLQSANQAVIKNDPRIHTAFKKMQSAAKEKNSYEAVCYAAEVLENLTGHLGLELWITGQFDEEF